MLLVEKLLGSSSAAAFIEDVFSTYLYTGNGGTQTITNNIDLSTKGGLVWIKGRDASYNHALFDTARGAGTSTTDNQALSSNLTSAEDLGSLANYLSAFTTSGFTVEGAGAVSPVFRMTNNSGNPYASWTFRKQAKFFDIVTYTGDGANRTIAHNLGAVPGYIMIKRTDTTAAWAVYHRSLANTQYMVLNTTAVVATGATYWNSTTPTSSVFSLGTSTDVNASGGTYVAYLFAHDAGGFGLNGTDNVISCGSYTGNNSTTGPVVTLGYEPQWLLIKRATGGAGNNWRILDNLRGFVVNGTDFTLSPNVTDLENAGTVVSPTATGFQLNTSNGDFNASASTYIYIAVRRGPMRIPSSGASVFNPVVYTGTNTDNRLVNTSIAPDMVMVRQRNDTVLTGLVVGDRLRGTPYLLTGSTAVEVNDADSFMTPTLGSGNSFAAMNGFGVGNDPTSKLNINTTSNNHVAEAFKRAPNFFDIAPYTGVSAATSVSHNLGATPELMIVKARTTAQGWPVYYGNNTQYLLLNTSAAAVSSNAYWNATAPTASGFSVGTDNAVNQNNVTYQAYLFASLPNVSKVGTYTGTAALQGVNCGFSSSARFVMIKRTDAAGNWYVWDSARGIVAGNDPYLLTDTSAAEVTTTDFIDTTTTGFEITAAASATVNINAASYIYLAIS